MLNSYGIRREIDRLGRVTIPVSFREDLGMQSGTVVVVCQTDDGILIQKVEDNKNEE